MDHHGASLSHESAAYQFKDALDRVLSGQVLPPMCMTFDITVTLALLDVANAVRQGRPTHQLVVRACEEFASCVLGIGSADQSTEGPRRRRAPRRDDALWPSGRTNPPLRSVAAETK